MAERLPAVRDTADVAAAVRAARGAQTPLRIVGAGHWLWGGAPSAATTELRLDALRGVVQYEPGDLTLTARAGTPLDELTRVTAAEGQWLPLDPFGPAAGTLGATVATASAGPLASAFGTPRDQVLGCEIVTGHGEIVRAGGRVVKNVAGFDLTRLTIGAWGTLGAFTEVTVRLRARPERDESIAVMLRGNDAAGELQRWLRRAPFTPFAAEVVSPALAKLLGIGESPALCLRVGGNEHLVRAALTAATTLGDHIPMSSAQWHSLALAEPAESAVFRLSASPTRAAILWNEAVPAVERAGGFAHWTPQRGIVRCVLPRVRGGDMLASAYGALASLPDVTCIAECGPAPLWARRGARAEIDRIARRVRDAFDPDRILNPGVLGELQ